MQYRTLVLLILMAGLFLNGCSGGSSGVGSSGQVNSSYTVSVSVVGLSPNSKITFKNNGTDTLIVSANGTFQFPTAMPNNAVYNVTISQQPSSELCSILPPSFNAGVIQGANVNNLTFQCLSTGNIVFETFHSFSQILVKGELTVDKSGNFYGVPYGYGSPAVGEIYRVTPSGTQSILYTFGGPPSDGTQPNAGMIIDSSGNLYGTTQFGGTNGLGTGGLGTIFKLSPSGTETVLYSFKGGVTDGSIPLPGLAMDNLGNIYGVTANDGAGGLGTVFKFTPTGIESVLHSFMGGVSDGGLPLGSPAIDGTGNLYVTTYAGPVGASIFKIAPNGVETLIHSFSGGFGPNGGLTIDASGNMFGTATGGIYGYGSVFMISDSGVWSEIHSFTNGADGGCPLGNLALDSSGALYGTTSNNSNVSCSGLGVVYRMTPNSGSWQFEILHTFTGTTDGGNPSPLTWDSSGNLYGTTQTGGQNNYGTIFKLSGL